MLCKTSRIGYKRLSKPTDLLYFQDDSINTKYHFHLKTDGYNNTKEISSLFSKEKRPLDLMNTEHKFSCVFYFLNYLQEDNTVILSEDGMEILYTFILNPSTYTDNSVKALPLAIQYFLSWKDKILREVSAYNDD